MAASEQTQAAGHRDSVDAVISVDEVARQALEIVRDISIDQLDALAGPKSRLRIDNLNAGYGQMEILHEFNLRVGSGQSLCLIGPNGAGKSTVLLLDEPTAGINPTLINGLIDRLKRANVEFGITMLIIEHNMRVIMNMASKIYCMAHGEMLAAGQPGEIQRDRNVIDAYLGAH